MNEQPWQLQLVRRSLKKREKLKLLNHVFSINEDETALDLGCAQGILSYFLRRKGGCWISTDLDLENCRTADAFLEGNCMQISSGFLPFRDESFDTVVCLDFLEHLDDDELCLREIRRVLKVNGVLFLAVPRTGRIFFLHHLREWMGMKLEFYGHKREGYRLSDLRLKLNRNGLFPGRRWRFAGFFTEFIELVLNLAYIKLFSVEDTSHLRDGHIRPSTSGEFVSQKKTFRLYGLFYPFVWLVSRLDRLFFWQRGYGLLIKATRTDGNS
ncbi:MAG: class I SAM-dependent methyltransferase [Candidatus Aminicenantes bacterium]|nr:class I SAM-dependent methyltransferase [Candidatus Aminicenantes bacterium]